MISWLIGVFWLFNPITAAVSVRGNAESVLGVFVLGCLYSLLRSRIVLAGLLFGTCIHLKLYPIIYALVVYLYLCDPPKPSLLRLPTARHWCFGFATLTSLLGLTGAGYWAYGWTFLHHAYFYHFTRVDFWHNFAPHFYPIYLFEGILAINSSDARAYFDANLFPYTYVPEWMLEAFFHPLVLEKTYSVFKKIIMLPSVVLISVLSFRYWQNQSFAWFAVTFTFVAFNKVCTSQYFLWWLVLLPPALAHIRSPQRHGFGPGRISRATGFSPTALSRCMSLAGLWFIGQALWLSIAYVHEMVGPPYWGRALWLELWTASCIYLVINLVVLKFLMAWMDSRRPDIPVVVDEDHGKMPTMKTYISRGKRFARDEESDVRKRNIIS